MQTEPSMSSRQRAIDSMKRDLLARVNEWVGTDYPSEGSEDFDAWKAKLAEIDHIECVQDVVDYVEGEHFDVNSFFIEGNHELISAGIAAEEVPLAVVKELGEQIAERACAGGSWVHTYHYDGKYFVAKKTGVEVFDDEGVALKSAGEVDKNADMLEAATVGPAACESNGPRPASPPAPNRRKRSRIVLIIVAEWPGGTMAIKFGSALFGALKAKKTDVTLVQMAPERIFRVTTSVTEEQFRASMRKQDVSCSGKVHFVDL